MIAAFNRVRMLTQDRTIILEALKGSPIVEIGIAGTMLRPRDAWANWVLPAEQRDHTAHAPPPVASTSPLATPQVPRTGSLPSAATVAVETPQTQPAATGEASSTVAPPSEASERQQPAVAITEIEAEPPVTPAKTVVPVDERTPVPEQRRRSGGEELDEDDMFQLDEVPPLTF